MTKFLLNTLALFFLVGSVAQAAPIPGSTSVTPSLGVFHSPVGFEIAAGLSEWRQLPAPKGNGFVAALFAPKQGNPSKTSLTVRIDHLTQPMSLAAYAKRWQREYPKYGFDVLGSKTFQQNQLTGYAIDLVQKDTKKEMRQVVFLQDKKAAVITCKDQETRFRDTLKACNQIVRTFKWTE